MKISKLIGGLLATCAALAFSGANAQDPIVIKFSHVAASNSPKGKAADYFKKLVEERSHGRIKVEVYPSGTLYKDKDELEALQLGAVQILAPAPGKFGPLGLRQFEVLDLPFLFDNLEQARKVFAAPVGRGMLQSLESKGIVGLNFWNNGFKDMTANTPLRTPADFKGLKMRVWSSKALDAQMRALGANPQVLGFSELYQALQTGVVDGEENPASNIYTAKLYEVQKYMTVSNHGWHGYVVIMNKQFFDRLPPDLRKIVSTSMQDATDYFDSIAQHENQAALDAIRKSGKTEIIELTPQQRNEWKKALMVVHKKMEKRVGKDLLESIYQVSGADPSKL